MQLPCDAHHRTRLVRHRTPAGKPLLPPNHRPAWVPVTVLDLMHYPTPVLVCKWQNMTTQPERTPAPRIFQDSLVLGVLELEEVLQQAGPSVRLDQTRLT